MASWHLLEVGYTSTWVMKMAKEAKASRLAKVEQTLTLVSHAWWDVHEGLSVWSFDGLGLKTIRGGFVGLGLNKLGVDGFVVWASNHRQRV